VDNMLMPKSKNGLVRVVTDEAEQQLILQSLHADAIGGSHFGQNATIRKVTERFWWRNVADQARQVVKSCEVCQKANPVNKAPPSTLHPVTVKSIFHRWGRRSCWAAQREPTRQQIHYRRDRSSI